MLDLGVLRDSGTFSMEAGPPRLALVHHGFRTTQLGFKLGLKDDRRLRFAPRFASLGLLNLARSLEVDFDEGRIPYAPEVRYFDEDCYEDDDDLARGIAEWLRPAPARFVLVGLYSLAIERTAGLLAKIDPTECCIVVGGAHPTVAPQVDYAHIAVRGEGGGAVRHILTTLFEPTFGEGLDARGLCFKLDGEEQVGRPAFDRSLATIPPPAFPYELSQSRSDPDQRPRVRWWMAVGRSPQIYICTQSCRARCSFCSTYLIHGRPVSRPVDFIEGDLDYIVGEFGHDSIEFHDDDLLQHEQFDELMDMLAAKGVTWTCNARSEFMTSERAEQMAAAGCRKVFLGVESLDQRSLDYYRKATTVEMNQNAVRVLDAVGIGVVCGFIIGAPHDTLETSLADIDRMLELPIFFLSASILTPDIGTLEYHRAMRAMPELQFLGDDGSKMNVRPRPELFGTAPPYGMPTMCKALSKDELNELYELACCEFFLRGPTLDRIERLTMPERMEDVRVWCRWIRERADRLASTARLEQVRERAVAIGDRRELVGQPA
jgi:anaerobic magnesium-protoporphyrin IX monomethyl ester cyclase